jgi:hypothetical protein
MIRIDTGFALGAFVLLSLNAIAAVPIPGDGWSSWEIEVPPQTRSWCCNTEDWRSRKQGCDLDRDSLNLSQTQASERVRVYLRAQGGEVRDVRAYASNCPVVSRQAITDLGTIDAGLSLTRVVATQVDSDRLFPAIVAHGSDAAAAELKRRALAARGEVRELAWFWFGQLGRPGAEDDLIAALSTASDGDAEHLVFALSQLPPDRAVAALVRVVEGTLPIGIRKRALFWLAQSDHPEALNHLPL